MPVQKTQASRARAFRYLNPFMRFMLHMPIKPMRGRLMLLTYTGRKSGRRYTVPVSYVREDAETLLAPGGGAWKPGLQPGRPVRLLLDGNRVCAQPKVISDRAEVAQLLPLLLKSNPRAETFIGVHLGPDGTPEARSLDLALAEGFAVVRFRLEGGN